MFGSSRSLILILDTPAKWSAKWPGRSRSASRAASLDRGREGRDDDSLGSSKFKYKTSRRGPLNHRVIGFGMSKASRLLVLWSLEKTSE